MKRTILTAGIALLAFGALFLVIKATDTEEKTTMPEQQNTQIEGDQAEQGNLDLPERAGDKPDVTNGIPHIQRDQTSPDEVYDKLVAETYKLEDIVGGESQSSLPGAQSISLTESLPINQSAIITGREFAHIHADPGRGSLHLVLPVADANHVVEKGWGVHHPFSTDGRIPGMVMVFAPRNDQEVATIIGIIEASRDYAIQGR